VKWIRPHCYVLLLVGVAWLTPISESLFAALADMRSNWFRRQATGEIVLVGIDPRSIENIGSWPWPRSLHAQLIDRLERSGVADIAFDVDFSSPSTQAEDDAFLGALRKAGGSVVLPIFMQAGELAEDKAKVYVNRPVSRFAESAWSALVNVPADRDAVVRRYPYGERIDGSLTPSMAALLAGTAKVQDGVFWLDHSIIPSSVPTVSYVDVLSGVPSVLQKLQGKKVIVGGTAIELGDRFTIPHGRIISGPLLQVLAAESLLQGRDLRRLSGILFLPAVVLLGVCLVGLRRYPASVRAIFLVAIGVATEAAAVYSQSVAPVILDTALFQVAAIAYLLALIWEEIDLRGLLSRIANNRFERVAMSLGDGLVCADHNAVITVCNPAAAAIFGYRAEEMVGQPIGAFFVADEKERLQAIFKSLPAKGQPAPGQTIELSGLRKNRQAFPIEMCSSGWEGVDGVQYGFVLRDVSVRKREAERIRYLAEYDALTGLANRNLLQRHISAELAKAQNHRQQVALLLLDLDNFKEINDTLGHTYGDRVLVAAGSRLDKLVAGTGRVARLGGDEFAVVVSGAGLEVQAGQLADRIVAAFSESPILIGERQLWVKGSVGLALYPEHGMTPDELLSNADLALYRAKASGRSQAFTFTQEFRSAFEERLLLEAELAQALKRGEFELFYQPQVELRTGKLVGAEALIRWRNPLRGLVSPAEFMPIVNTSVMACEVGAWVLETACRQGSTWQQKGHDIRVAVNLCSLQLRSGDFAAEISETLKQTGLSPTLLKLEVTEDIVLEDEGKALDNLRKLQKLGVKLAFDDFGTGYAGLSYLKKFPLNVLKIDKSFVGGLCTSSDDKAIVGATISISKQLGLSVIAEGIEDAATVELLRALGCEEGQGYYYGRPMPSQEFEQRFLKHPNSIEPTWRRAADAA
jgi:diguanylate cyclase (GGDEF)-like protein/PAS domain S-box-containing protein